jgi:hypothetical protein
VRLRIAALSQMAHPAGGIAGHQKAQHGGRNAWEEVPTPLVLG